MGRLLTAVLTGAFVVISLAAVMLPRLYANQFSERHETQPHAWATSDTCRSCHQDHYASWQRTFHRTMTQEATPKSVLGRFDGEVYRYWGVGVRPVRHGDKYYFEYLDDNDEVTVTLPVLRTVGSNRYQQYLVQTPDGGETYFRVHLLWHMQDQRWLHINGVFLRPDEQNFDDRIAIWDHNCIFCHNTGPTPRVQNLQEMGLQELSGEPLNSALDARYDSRVAELGIACEACHGPGQTHAKINRNPLRRFALHLSDATDPTITHPRKISQRRSVDVCGQCHGQRTPQTRNDLLAWIDSGPTFRAGDLLADHVRTVYRDIELPAGIDPELFRLRFWRDGTARLTAYEYQGLLQSACFQGGEITCISCHTLHTGDPHGNISEENRGNTPCLACHEEYTDDISAHTHHAADSPGSRCYECHMPKMVFGVTEIHRSHRIENPRPLRNRDDGRPDACTNCHIEETASWAQTQIETLWSGADANSNEDTQPSRLIESLHAGDPVQRAVAARVSGNVDAPGAAHERAWLIPHLLRAMGDHYPSTRNLARKSLVQLDEQLRGSGVTIGLHRSLGEFDFIGDIEHREQVLATLWQVWRDADKSALSRPTDQGLLDDDWMPREPGTSVLIEQGHSHTNQIAIGE